MYGARSIQPILLCVLLGIAPGAPASAALAQLQEFSDAMVELTARVKPAVVAVKTEKVVTSTAMRGPFRGTPFEDLFQGHPFFRMPRQMPRQAPQQRQEGLGSGVIVSRDGYILTNNHVITGSDRETVADRITVELVDRRSFEAEVVGRDPQSDLAVLKIDADDLPTVPYGDSDDTRVGETVLAVGNPFGQLHTVTAGMVSAVGRGYVGLADYEDYIQTDAAINPGNSGGALVNTRGELVGINTAIVTRGGGYQGIGFAIPVNMARNIMEQLVDHGEVRRGLLGVIIQPVTQEVAAAMGLEDPRGVLVGDVSEGGAADEAGVKRGDIILELDGEGIDDTSDLRNRIAMTAPGSRVRLRILRDGEEKMIRVVLGTLDEEQLAAASSSTEAAQRLGIKVQELTDDLAAQLGYEGEQGIVIASVRSGSVAERGGLRRGDLILEVDRRKVTTVRAYEEALDRAADRGTVLLLVLRENSTRFVALRMK